MIGIVILTSYKKKDINKKQDIFEQVFRNEKISIKKILN